MATAQIDTDEYPPLDESKFVITHDVPIFDEHDIEEPVRDESGQVMRDADGQPLTRKRRYSAEVLEAMAENMNRRIRDTGDYAALVVGHTPDPEQRRSGMAMPPLVGFSGPFYVGMFGDENPRATIYAKNWAIFKDSAELAGKHPRRSVEVWATPDLKDRYFDPIALLGAETPRRDLGLVYSRSNPKIPVHRYTACFPSGTNTFIPGAGLSSDKDRRYEAPEMVDQPTDKPLEDPMALSEQDIQQIVAAVMETAPMKWCAAQMEKEAAKVPPEAAPEVTPENPAPDAAPDALAKERNEEPEKKEETVADDTAKETDKVNEPEKYRKDREAEKQRYAAIERQNRDLVVQVNTLSATVKELTDRNTLQERYSKLAELDGVVLFDREKEQERVKTMTSEQFDAHLEIMREHYEKNPVGIQPLSPRLFGPTKAPIKEEDFNAKVQQLVDRYAREGKWKSYAEVEAEVKKELNGQAA